LDLTDLLCPDARANPALHGTDPRASTSRDRRAEKALFLAVRDWRRAARHTALGGLLDGTLRFGWGRPGVDTGALEPVDEVVSEGLVGAEPPW
jgi:hypothetical protein